MELKSPSNKKKNLTKKFIHSQLRLCQLLPPQLKLLHQLQPHLPHPLRGFHDHWYYHHELADVLAQRIVDSGATHMLFFNVPHLVHDTLVYQVGQALGLQCLIVTQSLFPNTFFSMPAIEAYGPSNPLFGPLLPGEKCH